MIARSPGCDTSRLPLLLDDTLDNPEANQLTAHVEACPSCRDTLEQLAAGPVWWNDTREVLVELEELGATIQPDDLAQASRSDLSKADLQDLNSQPSGHLPTRARQAEEDSRDHWVLGLLEPPAAEDELGQLDGVRIDAVVGQGGMGVVLRAHDSALHRLLAIKLLSPMLASNGAARQRFFREAQSAASVVHPNIVPIFSVSEDRALPYIVMPYVSGGNLQQLLDAEGPLGIERVLSLGHQVAEGLAAAHAQGIVHRDIKPANLMLDGGGFRVMLTDFGLARALDDTTLTASGMLAGTPQYMSPEQARGGAVDHRSDIYSLGAVLYTLATGRPPVQGSSTMDVLSKIGQQSPPEVYEVNASYPKWFGQVVERLMRPQIDRRPQTAAEVAALLRDCLAHVRCPHQVALPAGIGHSNKRLSRRLITAAGISIFVSLLLLLGQFLLPMFGATKPQPEINGLPDDKVPAVQAGESLGPSPNSDTLNQRPRPDLNLPPTLPWQDIDLDTQLDAAEQELFQLQMELQGYPIDFHELAPGK